MIHDPLTAQSPSDLPATPSAGAVDTPAEIRAAPLSDPLYYLRNLHTVFHWVLGHHSDLLTAAEQHTLRAALSPSAAGQALLARLIMRKGEHFRSDKLSYAEIPQLSDALAELAAWGWIEQDPALTGDALAALCRRQELLVLLRQRGENPAASQRKAQLIEQLAADSAEPEAMPLSQWWPSAPFRVVRLCHSELVERVRLMFFGNLHQQWSEFVLTELGHQHYESVAFSPDSRAFQCRQDVDHFIALHHCLQALEDGQAPAAVYATLPPTSRNSWLQRRRLRVAYSLAQCAERQGDDDFALARYRDNPLPDAQVRYFRLAEKRTPSEALLTHIEGALAQAPSDLSQLHLQRVKTRVARKLGRKVPPIPKVDIPCQQLALNYDHSGRVELATLRHLTAAPDQQGFYTENTLFTGLLALLLWPALYAPLPGAFFHPFQAGPADLFRPDFVSRRQALIEERLATLDSGEYRDRIRDCWQQKFGLSCPLVHWPALPETLLTLALEVIPSAHLDAIFRHLLSDLRHHRSGMPDLILFNTRAGSYQLVEVKGPGDRLQDNQRLTIQRLLEAGVPVQLAHIERLS